MVSGVHGSAWTAAVKDLTILAVVLFLGIYLPIHYYGGLRRDVRGDRGSEAGFLKLPATGESPAWFVSTVLLTALGFYMWPHTFGSLYTARNEQTFRKNAIVLPLYQLILLFVFFVGFAAVLQVPGLKGGEHRSFVVSPVAPDIRPVGDRHHRLRGRANRDRPGLDDPDVGGDAARQQPVPGRPPFGG